MLTCLGTFIFFHLSHQVLKFVKLFLFFCCSTYVVWVCEANYFTIIACWCYLQSYYMQIESTCSDLMFSLDVISSQKFQILIHHDDLCFICMFFLPNRNCFVPSTIYHLCVCVILLCLRNFLYIGSSLSIQLEFQISFTHSLVSQKFQRHSTSDLPRQVLSKMSKLKIMCLTKRSSFCHIYHVPFNDCTKTLQQCMKGSVLKTLITVHCLSTI